MDQIKKKAPRGNLSAFSPAKPRAAGAKPSLLELGKAALLEGRKGCSISLLREALSHFKEASKLENNLFEVHLHAGITYLSLEKATGAFHYIGEAAKRFEKARSAAGGRGDHPLLDWNEALAAQKLGSHYGEPLEVQRSINLFEKARNSSRRFPAQFWIDYALSHKLLAEKTSSFTPYERAAGLLKNALTENPSSAHAWEELGHTLFQLYFATRNPSQVNRADSCFGSALHWLAPSPDESSSDQKMGELYLRWASNLLEVGRANRDEHTLKSAIEKCQFAANHLGQTPELLALWADALSIYALDNEDRFLLLQAKQKIEQAYTKERATPQICYAYGNVLAANGRYFEELDTLFRATEKYQEGLSINSALPKLWTALAEVFAETALMENRGDDAPFELYHRASHCYTKALNLMPSAPLLFDCACHLYTYALQTEKEEDYAFAIKQFQSAFAAFGGPFVNLAPHWITTYAAALCALGQVLESENHYLLANECYKRLLLIDPDYPDLHANYAGALVCLSTYKEDREANDLLIKAVHHFRIAHNSDPENDEILVDWASVLITLADESLFEAEMDELYFDAETKLCQAAALGNTRGLYLLASLYAILGKNEKSISLLQKASEYDALPPVEEMLEDDSLDGVRGTSAFRSFISQLQSRPS